ncbi:MAG: hypothetical protein H6817_09805 [Phycisphaerales bacterium]|nr:hypothetical protein [Phycisphaerales bacterium]
MQQRTLLIGRRSIAELIVQVTLAVGLVVALPARAEDQPSTPQSVPYSHELPRSIDRSPAVTEFGGPQYRLTSIPLNFLGSQFNVDSGFFPPDTMGAVGPDHIVELINGRYDVYQKSTGIEVETQSLVGFFVTKVGLASPPVNSCVADVCTLSGADCSVNACRANTIVDPRIVFDPRTNRWFAVGIDLFSNNNIYVARSDTDDPTGDWDGVRFAADTVGGGDEFHDYPTMSVDADGLFICTQDFNGPGNESCYSIPKADLLLAVPSVANMTRFEATPANLPTVDGSIQAALGFGPSDGHVPILGTSGGSLIRGNINGANAAGATLSATVGITGDPGHASPPAARQPHPNDPSVTLENVAPRFVANVFELGDSLWAVHSVQGSGSNAALRWYEIDETTNTVLQTGLIENTDEDYHEPSIVASPLGDVVIGYTCSGPNLAPSSCVSVGETNAGTTTFAARTILQTGAGHYFQDGGTGRNRWGDYSATVIDPTNPCAFWTFQEIVAVSAVGDVGPDPRSPGGAWGVQITQICTDDEDPMVSGFVATPGNVDTNCMYEVPFSATVTDNCSISSGNVQAGSSLVSGSATVGSPFFTATQNGIDQVDISGYLMVTDLTTPTATIEIQLMATDNCDSTGLFSIQVDVADIIPPQIEPAIFDSNGPYEMSADCTTTIGFSITMTDNCCVDTNAITVTPVLPGNVTLANLSYVLNVISVDEVEVVGQMILQDLMQTAPPNDGCITEVGLQAGVFDCAGNSAQGLVGTNSVVDVTPPELTCPEDVVYDRGLVQCPPLTPAQWLASAMATDNCSIPMITNDADSVGLPCGGFPCDGDNFVTFTAVDECGNVSTCGATLTVVPRHPGWNNVDVGINLTSHQPTYWSALSGNPAGVTNFPILDPGCLPGRKATDGSGDRVLRGYIVAWAVDNNGVEIRWNHLKGDVVIVNYDKGTAWEYTTYSFAVVNGAANGAPTGLTPGQLDLDGIEYDRGYGMLLLDFYASGASPFGSQSALDTDLTLLPISVDLRQETTGPVTTKASFTVWNQNEVKLTGMDRCVTCWDQQLVSLYADPNYFLRGNLQTDKGKAQIVGINSQLCDFDYDPGDVCTQNALAADPNASGADPACDPRDTLSQDASLLGVVAKQMAFTPNGPYDAAGMNLIGMGYQDALIRADFAGGPPDERPGDIGGSRTPTRTGRQAGDLSATNADEPAALLAANDRGSASEKGSLLIFPKVELRWNALGDTLIQDTFIDLTNDYPGDVHVQMYFINGDPMIVP